MEEDLDENVFPIPDPLTIADPFLTYNETLRRSKAAIIIDNGSCQSKAGWSIKDTPSLVFRNHIARLRGKKDNDVQVGNDIQNIETIRWLLKTQFDKNVVTQFDVQEIIFDYIFSHLGINTEGRVEHPIVITEALCNPNYSRQMMSELLFECYQVPQVAYGIDSLFAFYYNRAKENVKNCLIVSLGHNTVHVIPILDHRLNVEHSRRINLGGQQMTTYLHRLLQLKCPFHSSSITPSRIEYLENIDPESFASIATLEKAVQSQNDLNRHQSDFINGLFLLSECYSEDLNKWENEEFYVKNVHKIQLPFVPLPASALDTEEGRFDKCNEILKHVQAMKIKRRTEKLTYGEERMQELLSVQELFEDEDDEAILALQELGYSTVSELQAGIKELDCKIQKLKNTILNQQGEDSQDSPLKGWCDDLDINLFPDVETWIESVRQKEAELIENPVRARSGIASNELTGFSFSRALDMIGGLHEICGTDQLYTDYVSETEERKEHLEILNEIITEYNRELGKSEPSVSSYNMAEFYQLPIGVEQIRIPEIVYQPMLLGIEQAGVAETIEMVLSSYNPIQQQQLAENVFLTGGCSKIPQARSRLVAELMAIRPFQSKFNVYLADDPVLDAWKGAKRWATFSNNLSKYGVTKLDYEEKGGEYFKEHNFSNRYFPTPPSLRKISDSSTASKPGQKTS